MKLRIAVIATVSALSLALAQTPGHLSLVPPVITNIQAFAPADCCGEPLEVTFQFTNGVSGSTEPAWLYMITRNGLIVGSVDPHWQPQSAPGVYTYKNYSTMVNAPAQSMQPNTTYTYRVQVSDQYGAFALSAPVSVTTTGLPTFPPHVITSFTVTPSSKLPNETSQLHWTIDGQPARSCTKGNCGDNITSSDTVDGHDLTYMLDSSGIPFANAYPTVTTTYTLHVLDQLGFGGVKGPETTATVTLTVNGSAPPPPPPPPPPPSPPPSVGTTFSNCVVTASSATSVTLVCKP